MSAVDTRRPRFALRRSRRRDLPEVPGRADVLALSALVLAYPDDDFLAAADDLGTAIHALPASPAADRLRAFWAETAAWDPEQWREHYVQTFDLRRSTAPYLTYYLHGDTRRRGAALLALKKTYRACGFVPPEDELPDHLPVVLEFAARAGTGAGESALRAHRAGFEVLRQELSRRGSPYHRVLDAVAVVLGPVADAVQQRAEAIALAGPPADDVGLGAPLPGYGEGMPYPPSAACAPARTAAVPLEFPTTRPAPRPEGP